jgi:integrase
MSIETASEEFLISLKRTTQRHQRDVKRCLNEFIEEFKIESIGDIHLNQIEKLKSTSHLGLLALKRKITHIKHFSKYLAKMSYLDSNPLLYATPPKGKLKEKRALEDYEVTLLLEALQKFAPSIYLPMYVICFSGLRKNECLTLEWDENIDFNRNVIIVKDKPHILVENEPFYCKWGSERIVPLADSVLNLLKRLKEQSKSNWVFPNKNGDRISNNINRAFNNARKKSGLNRPEEITPHTLRHTWISQLLRQGVDLKSVSSMAGHKNLTTTQRYAHLLGGVEKMHMDIAKLPNF